MESGQCCSSKKVVLRLQSQLSINHKPVPLALGHQKYGFKVLGNLHIGIEV